MKQELFNLYNNCKSKFVEAIISTLKKQNLTKKEFSPSPIKIFMSRDSDDLLEDIVSIEYDEKENLWYAHNYITDTNLDVSEYWTPLFDLKFYELFEIAERL